MCFGIGYCTNHVRMIHEWKYFLVDETKTMASSTEEVFKFFGALVGKSMTSRVSIKNKNVFN